jgi:hypothetical protein
VASSTVVLVVDLSDPGAVLPSLLHWLGLLRQRLAATYALFDKKGLQLPEQLRARARARWAAQRAAATCWQRRRLQAAGCRLIAA